jgi:hypothetical protein
MIIVFATPQFAESAQMIINRQKKGKKSTNVSTKFNIDYFLIISYHYLSHFL